MDGSFEEYATTRGRALLRFGYVLSGDRYLAEDLVQEVLARLHLRWHRIAQVEQPHAYVRTAIVQQFLSWRRLRASRGTSSDRLPEQPAAEIAEVLGCRETTVRVHASRGLARLRHVLEPPATVTETIGGKP